MSVNASLVSLSETIEHLRMEATDLGQPFLAYLLEMASLEILRQLGPTPQKINPSKKCNARKLVNLEQS